MRGSDPIEAAAASGPETGQGRRERSLRLATLAVVVAGVALRVGAARGDLWLDEIWSVLIARLAGSPLGVFRVHLDNNNYLNTLWLMWVGGDSAPLVCRGLALLASAGTLAWLAARPLERGARGGLITAWLTAFSYVLVHYGSEARGYAPAMFFSVAAYQALDRYLVSRSGRWGLGFAAFGVLALLSHLTSVIVLAGAGAWAGVELARQRRVRPPGLSTLLLLIPFAALGALWAVDLQYVQVGRGPESTGASVVRELVRSAHGLPSGPLELLALFSVVAAGAELVRLLRARDSRAAFFLVVVLPPLAALAWSRPSYLTARHFVVVVPFLFLLAGAWLSRQARGAGGRRLAVGVLLLAFLVGNGFAIRRLLELGRGDYEGALRLMLATAPAGVVTVAGDHDWRTMTVLQYHARILGAAGRFFYVLSDGWGKDGPDFYLEHDFAERPIAADSYAGANGIRYRLVAVFPYAGLSGWSWLLYARIRTADPGTGVALH